MKPKPEIDWIYRGTGLWEGIVFVGKLPIAVAYIDGTFNCLGVPEFKVTALTHRSKDQRAPTLTTLPLRKIALVDAKRYAAENALYPEVPQRYNISRDEFTGQFEYHKNDEGEVIKANEFFRSQNT